MGMQGLLVYSQADVALANSIATGLLQNGIDLSRHPLGTREKTPKPLPALLKSHDAIVQIVSTRCLTSLDCMQSLIALIKDDQYRAQYRECTIPVIAKGADGDPDISDTRGQLEMVDIWIDETNKLEEELSPRSHVGTPLNDLRDELAATREVAEHILRFMRTITDHIYAIQHEEDTTLVVPKIVGHLNRIQDRNGNGASPDIEQAPPLGVEWRENLRRIHDGITVASEDDPARPEFPPFAPRFPATPIEEIKIPQLDRPIFIKDESRNFTGSHKDRMAWEIVVHYKKIIEDLLAPSSNRPTIPTASIISNGSAAYAIQVMMRCYGLPDLRVLVDQRTDKAIVQKLRRAGCNVFIHDLSEKELKPEDVLDLTENSDGLDFTSRDLVDPNRRTYYDWLAYEILNCGAKHIFIPVGTGDLFVNVLTVLRDERMGITRDRRLDGGSRRLEGLELYGATSSDWRTDMDKLWAKFRPTLDEARRVVAEVQSDGYCGPRSEIYDVDEDFVRGALEAARGAGIRCDESGIAGLSLLLQLNDEVAIPRDEKILVVNTGWLALP